jgi:RNA polymerase sigma-70 factor (ECF subfamily)
LENLTHQLVAGCAMQNPQYQQILYDAYYGKLMKVAFRYVSTYEQALVLTQHGFLKIFQEIIQFGFGQNMVSKDDLSSWIKRTFIVKLVDHIKSELTSHMPRPVPDDQWKQHDRPFTDAEMINIKLIKILKALPTVSRLVFNLHIIDGFTHYEISGMLGITVESSTQNLVKAREYCKRSLGSPSSQVNQNPDHY